MGFPEPSVSFPRVLEVMLRARYPKSRVEVVNTAVVAINSHIIRSVASECVELQPDLLVVHVGNNEVVGPFGATGVFGPYTPLNRLVRWNLAIRASRTGQLLSSLTASLRGQEQRAWKGMAMFMGSEVRADDERLKRIQEQFRSNLADICRKARSRDIPVVVCTIPVNLEDSPPFASLHSKDLSPERTRTWDALFAKGVEFERQGNHAAAVVHYEEAGRLDDQFAELQFREARCLVALGRLDAARDKFGRARDLDTLRFRTDSALNRIIRETTADFSGKGVMLADAETAFADASPAGLPGDNLFLEHVHMNFSGNYLLARTVFQSAVPSLDARSNPGSQAPLDEPECAKRLAYTTWNRLKLAKELKGRVLAIPPFTAQLDHASRISRLEKGSEELQQKLDRTEIERVVDVYRDAVAANRTDWMLRMNYGLLLSELDRLPAAEDQYRAVLGIMHHAYPARSQLGKLCLADGRFDEAARHYQEVIKQAPEWQEGHLGFAETLGARGKIDEGLAIYEKWLPKAPSRSTGCLGVARYLVRAGRLEAAKAWLGEAIAADPGAAAPYVELGDIAVREGKPREAIELLGKAIEREPGRADLKDRITRLEKASK